VTWGIRAAALVGAVLLAAACGQSAGSRVAGAGGSAPAASASPNPAQLYAQFAACVRHHGGNEPDPTIDDSGQPHWQVPLDSVPLANKQACFSILQQARGQVAGKAPDAATLAAEVKFSQCMRQNGVPGFPDPDPSTGDFTGADRTSPQVQAVYVKCRSLLPAGVG
jgi:hypothetical protein